MSKTENKSWDFLWCALYAFAGLGLELLLLGLVEPVLFGGTTSGDYSDTQRILHWLLTILCWGAMIALLTHFSKRKLQFDPLARRPFSKKGLGAAAVLAAVCVLLNALDWGTLKIVGEWQSKGALLFFFQYVYYLFEIGLVFLIVAFGQRFAEGLLRKESRIPFGGLVLCFTWGIIHMLSQGNISTGLGVMAFALLYGGIYLLLNRDSLCAYLLMALAFVL